MGAGLGRVERSRSKGSTSSPRVETPVWSFSAATFRSRLAAWYQANARKLPWRGVDDPYATWLSEIMLQQTRVATVMERYKEFLRRFPTLRALAAAEEDEVLALWSGLGYYRRARMLHRGAQFVVRELGNDLPRTAAELRTLPGVGDYTAAAIASIAFGEPVAVLDGNVERVLLRLLGKGEQEMPRGELAAAAQRLMPLRVRRAGGSSNSAGDHNQAMMELGATICLPRQPLCLQCPVVRMCATRGEHATAKRAKQQSRVVAHLLAVRKRSTTTEVLLERRPADASLMAGMMELPPLPLEAVKGYEPVLRLRHAITNTNYYVEVYAESAAGARPEEYHEIGDEATADQATDAPWSARHHRRGSAEMETGDAAADAEDDDLFEADTGDVVSGGLLREVSAAATDLEWVSAAHLAQRPLTGLARKVLQRLGVMAVPKVRIG